MGLRKRQTGNYTIYIACEGAVSEKEYFEAIKDDVIQEWNVSLDIYPYNTDSPNDAKTLVELAQQNIGKYSEVWAVFDKDGEPPLDALKLAQTIGPKINIGYSSIAFEQWVLLHFEKNSTAYAKSDCKESVHDNHFFCGNEIKNKNHPEDCQGVRCVANTIRRRYLPEYSKNSRYGLYAKIKANNNIALENSSWLRFVMKTDSDAYNNATTHPFTNLDILLKRLLQIEENIEWKNLNQQHFLGSVDAEVRVAGSNIITLIIQNKKDRYFWNNNSNDTFYISNDTQQKSKLIYKGAVLTNNSGEARESTNTVLLYETDSVQMEFEIQPDINGPIYFNFKSGDNRFMFPLS